MLLIPGEDGKWIEMKEYATISVQSKEELETLMKCAEFQWRPVSKELPGEGKLVIVSVRVPEWITDYDSDWVPEEEKIRIPERSYATIGFYRNDKWMFLDDYGDNNCDRTMKKATKPKDVTIAYPCEEVIAWMPLPEPFRDLEGKQYGKTNI